MNSDEIASNQANQDLANVINSSANAKNDAATENANRLAATIGQQNAAKQGNVDILQGKVNGYTDTTNTNFTTAVNNANNLLGASVSNQGIQALIAQS